MMPSQPDNSLDQSDEQATVLTGYIGMLAVSQDYRRRGIGQTLVRMVLQRMQALGCHSVTLETEVTNKHAQRLYQDIFGFIREELLVRYYLNWNDAYRLRLWFDYPDYNSAIATLKSLKLQAD
jgi:ribosomal protein S18 acetylase RimI-like enzyme